MVVHLKPETESRLKELSATTGRAPDELVEDAMAGYLAELAQIRGTLDGRYDEIKSGRVKPIDGEEAFNRIRSKSDRRRSRAASFSTQTPSQNLKKFGNSLRQTLSRLRTACWKKSTRRFAPSVVSLRLVISAPI
jgi:predicted DNA-binding protein